MELTDLLRLTHPALAATVVLPLIGIVSYFAWQTRQRRLEALVGAKSKIPPQVGADHVRLGRMLTNGVVGLCLLGFAHPIIKHIIHENIWSSSPYQVIFVGLVYGLTLLSLLFLNRAKPIQRGWRYFLAVLTAAGVLILGWQDGVFHRDSEWYVSHFYSGITATLLMIFSMAILPEIYQDKSQTWRRVHIAANSIALFLFIMQGLTGVRDLLEIPLAWQEPYIYQCDYVQKTCGTIQSSLPTSTGWSISTRNF
ncbi:MAG: DUF4079 domain-containing protein [Cyanobacteriota bacterium]|nr:DUF4079 domain-containing protein [Cyanobacteriota bacterium]